MSRLSADLHNPAIIHVLPEEVASKIAAGEVVERPASVVRELVDNAIDAGAHHVRVEIRGGGRELIRVGDDGCGVRPEDVPRAFLRHATSKIKTADDLWAVKTLGFRGEALFSVAAVSRMSFLSRPLDAAVGFEMVVEGGHVVSHGPKGAPLGTVVSVRDLFFNLPARLKFLKSPQAEAAHIAALVQQYALAHPGVRFTLTSEGRQTFQSPGDGDLRTAAACVYGTEVARVFLPVGVEPEDDVDEWDSLVDLGVYGYVSPPAHSRSNRQAMLFFVNRRAIQSRMLQYAVAEAYHSLLMVGRHPICIVHLSIAPGLLDVNVHPAKAEVKFRDERAVFSAVQKAVRSALQAHVPAPAFGSRGSEGWGFGNGAPGIEAEFSTAAPYVGGFGSTGEAEQADMWAETNAPAHSQPQDEAIEPLPAPKQRTLPPLRVVGQVGATYIIAEGPDGLFLVDQHAAHERVLYEQLGDAMSGGSLMVQPLLTPVPLELTSHQRSLVEPVLPLLSELGFQLEAFGDSALLVRAVPAVYASSNRDTGGALLELIDEVMSGTAPDRWREEMAITLACHSAIRAGQLLSLDEMRALLGQLELCRYPRSCAHGRPTMLHLSQMQLEREFGRRA
ncbi:MAG: DNA mismatch repair endonuclease MutL [Chloroflexota bacterium]|nr:DNA mismatch repair endonuclease MutL [Chloroflexota bacterium]MDQ5864100.1 DNA mismatch repair endonuclease MutL [Chloroflexota bacterium]